jgi:hypothetical protein
MDIREKVQRLQALRTQFSEKQAELARARKLRERSVVNLSRLLESDLEQAKLILAAKDVCDRLQKIAEHLAELGAEEIMPLSDAMKGAFGPEAASTFEHSANSNIQNALETVRAAKDSINDAILQVEGKLSPQNDMSNPDAAANGAPDAGNDMAAFPGGDDAGAAAGAPPPAGQAPAAGDDAFAGADAASGPQDEPLGRAVKGESRMFKRSALEGKTYRRDSDDEDAKTKACKKQDKKNKTKKQVDESSRLVKAGSKILESVTLQQLTNWLLQEAAKHMNSHGIATLAGKVSAKATQNPTWLAGYIAEKRWGRAAIQNLLESAEPKSRAETIAEAIANAINTNVSLFGKGRAHSVVESFTDLNESESSSVLEAFSRMYGCTPASYSLQQMLTIKEDGPVPPTDPEDDQPAGQSTLTPDDKQKAGSAIGKIAGKMASNPSLANQPMAAAMQGLDPTSQSALQKVAADKSKGIVTTVGQLVQNTSDKVDEAKRASKGENVEGDKKNVGKAKKAKGTNAKDTITKESLIRLGESKIHHHKTKHHHPSYVMGIGGYYAGLPRGAFVGGYAGCDPGHGCKGWDTASDHDTGAGGSGGGPSAGGGAPAGGGGAMAGGGGGVGESRIPTYEEEVEKVFKKRFNDKERVKNYHKDKGTDPMTPFPYVQPGAKKDKADKTNVVENDSVLDQVKKKF